MYSYMCIIWIYVLIYLQTSGILYWTVHRTAYFQCDNPLPVSIHVFRNYRSCIYNRLVMSRPVSCPSQAPLVPPGDPLWHQVNRLPWSIRRGARVQSPVVCKKLSRGHLPCGEGEGISSGCDWDCRVYLPCQFVDTNLENMDVSIVEHNLFLEVILKAIPQCR